MSVDLRQHVLGADFQNPLMLAAGTAGYGIELDGIVDLDSLGGLVTKAVTPEMRAGNPAPRVAEFAAGMINSVGLANVGLDEFRAHKLPWLARRLTRARVLVTSPARPSRSSSPSCVRSTISPASPRSSSTFPART